MHIASEVSQQMMVKLHTVQWKHVEKACDDTIIYQLCITNTVSCPSGQKEEIEEGIPYIAGNMLWVVYQFIVVIVLLSILRARMVNTYHRIFKEADVQWKYFRSDVLPYHYSITITHNGQHLSQGEHLVEIPGPGHHVATTLHCVVLPAPLSKVDCGHHHLFLLSKVRLKFDLITFNLG